MGYEDQTVPRGVCFSDKQSLEVCVFAIGFHKRAGRELLRAGALVRLKSATPPTPILDYSLGDHKSATPQKIFLISMLQGFLYADIVGLRDFHGDADGNMSRFNCAQ